MSPNTITAPAYEIREGLTPDKCPCIEGVVDGQVIILAFEGIASRAPQTATRHWYLGTFADAVAQTGVQHPNPIEAWTKSDARAWVEFITALYARATSEPVDVLLDEPDSPTVRELAEELPREIGNSRFLSRLVDIEGIR